MYKFKQFGHFLDVRHFHIKKIKKRTLLLLVMLNKNKLSLLCLVSDVFAVVMVSTQALCCRAVPDADRSTDQSSFAEAHAALIDGQVPHAAHVCLRGGDALWEEKIWKGGGVRLEKFDIWNKGENQYR